MKKILLFLLLMTIINHIHGDRGSLQNKGFGLGIIAGLPSGLTMRTWGSGWSWDLLVGGYKEDFGLYRVEGFFVHGDLLRQKVVTDKQFFFYYGPGLGFVSGTAFGFFGHEVGSGKGVGPRFNVGFDYFPSENWNLFIELAPSLYFGDFDEETTMYQVESGIGARYVF
jgi:hypothetical protein